MQGNPVPVAVARRIQSEQAAPISNLLEAAAIKINNELESCLSIHLGTPPPDRQPSTLPPFDVPAPVEPQLEKISILDRILMRGADLEQEQAQQLSEYHTELEAWERARAAHADAQREIEKALRLARNGFAAGMEGTLEYVLAGIRWPKTTQVAYAFSYDQTALALDVDLPDEGETPQVLAEPKGSRLAMKRRTDAQVRRDFVALCFGSLFRVAGEAFAALPTISKCLISGYIQRVDPATATSRDDYIISVVVDRSDWEQIDFSSLEMLDPAAALKTLGARFALDRSARFNPITPFTLADAGVLV